MTRQSFIKYPIDRKVLQALKEKDPNFMEICNDYEKICLWLDTHCHYENPPSKACIRGFEIRQELENEIKEVLRDAGF